MIPGHAMMFTKIIALCICCSEDDTSDDAKATPDGLQPLLNFLDRSSHSTPTMPRARTYGKRKQTATAAATAIFGAASSPSSPHQYLWPSPARAPLGDVTKLHSNITAREDTADRDVARLLSGLKVREDDGGRDDESQSAASPELQSPHHPKTTLSSSQLKDEYTIKDYETHESLSSTPPYADSQESDDASIRFRDAQFRADGLALMPLINAYHDDFQCELIPEAWEVVLPAGSDVVKIAEASYAEVYRVSIDGSDSILKVMQLKIPSDPTSFHCYTAIDVSQVVSEVRVMNALTEYAGFVTFKAAHLIRGKPCSSLVEARNACERWDPKTGLSSFPDQARLTDNSTFLAIELGDAGEVLDEVELETIHEVWDIFLGVIVALAAAEAIFQFEHRDLHENNICIRLTEPTVTDASESSSKYGRSGLEVTILDYGLSRATLPDGDIVYNDLEKDLVVFQGAPGHAQFDTYRRMRTHLLTGTRGMFAAHWHRGGSELENSGHTWAEFTPYSNVLWIKYILGYLKKVFKKCGGDPRERARFHIETKELSKRLNPLTLVKNGAFSTALEVYEYVIGEGWITKDQVATMTECGSILSEGEGAKHGEDEGGEDDE